MSLRNLGQRWLDAGGGWAPGMRSCNGYRVGDGTPPPKGLDVPDFADPAT